MNVFTTPIHTFFFLYIFDLKIVTKIKLSYLMSKTKRWNLSLNNLYSIWLFKGKYLRMGLLTDTQNCGLRMRREYREGFPRHRGLAIPTCTAARAWRMPGSPTNDFLLSRWRGKRSRHSRRMHTPQFCVSGKRPMDSEGTIISHTTYTWCTQVDISMV